jgi:hypothetical protein
MIEKIFRWLRRITGFSTPIGGISWSPSKTKYDDIPKYNGLILITSGSNDDLISFLEKNSGRIVILDAIIDASVSTLEEIEFVKKNDIDLAPFTSGGNGTYPLRNTLEGLFYIKFHLAPNHVLNYSAGGTGIVTVSMNGFFELSSTFHGGPSTMFHLKEIEVPLEARLELLNRSSKVL